MPFIIHVPSLTIVASNLIASPNFCRLLFVAHAISISFSFFPYIISSSGRKFQVHIYRLLQTFITNLMTTIFINYSITNCYIAIIVMQNLPLLKLV